MAAERRVRWVQEWADFGWLRAGFSLRFGGVSRGFAEVPEEGLLNLGLVPYDDPAAVMENRRRLLEAVGDRAGDEGKQGSRDGDDGGAGEQSEPWSLVVARQIHEVTVRRVTRENAAEAMEGGRGRWEADGLLTNEQGLLLGAGAADCVPLLVADLRLRAVAALHAGWRGTAAGMAGAGLARMREEFGTRPEDCMVAVGPSIGACCYQVGEEVAHAFRDEPEEGQGRVLREDGERWRLDLWEANRRQLLRAGVPPSAVTVVGECTACSRDEQGRRRYFSHRAENGRAGRMLGVIGIRSEAPA